MWAKDRSSVERSLVAIAAIAATIGALTTTLTSAPSPVTAEPASATPVVTAVANTATEAATTDAPPSDHAPSDNRPENDRASAASTAPEVTMTEPGAPSPIPAPPEQEAAAEPAAEPVTIAEAESIDALRSATDLTAEDAHVLRLYQAFYGRQPDIEGARFWIDQRRSGASIDTIASAFAESEEFAATYGDLDDAAFVESAYRTALGRDIDTSGFAYWVVELDRGVSRESVLVFFTSSDEFVATSPETGANEAHTASS